MPTRIHVPLIFRDSESIYLEFPSIPDGPQGYVLRFPVTEGGFAKACKHIPDISPPPGHAAVAPRVLPIAMDRKVRMAKTRKKPSRFAKEESKEFLTKIGLRPK